MHLSRARGSHPTMTIFSWLLIGHLVGDWLLQNDWMAQNKQRHLITAAGLVHFTIYTLTMTITLWFWAREPLTVQQIATFAFLTFVSHWLIDALALAKKWGQMVKQSNQVFVAITVDQAFHIIVIGLLIRLLFDQ